MQLRATVQERAACLDPPPCSGQVLAAQKLQLEPLGITSSTTVCSSQASATTSRTGRLWLDTTCCGRAVKQAPVSLCSPYIRQRPGASSGCARLHRVNNFLKVHADARRVQVLVVGGLVYELRHFVQPQLRTPPQCVCKAQNVVARRCAQVQGGAAPAWRACQTQRASRQ